MNGTIIIGALALLTALVAFGLVGFKQRRKTEANLANVTREALRQNPHAEILGRITYHGGFPQMPKPSVLQIGLTGDSLLLYDFKGWSGKVYFRDWRDVERFTTLVKADIRGKSTMLGPLLPFFFKDTMRHFIAIKYKDTNWEENCLLLEADDETSQQRIYDKLLIPKKEICPGRQE